MPDINPSLPIVGQPDSTEEPKVVTALSQLIAAVNNVDTDQIADGAVEPQDLQASLLDVLGVTAGGISRRGKAIIPATETRNNAAYGTMPTADKVTVALPTDGLIFMVYQAIAASSAGDAAAAIFLNENQVQAHASINGSATPVAQNVGIVTAGSDRPIVSHPGGLIQPNGPATEPTTGLLVGFAAVGGNPSGMGTGYGVSGINFSNVSAMVGGPTMIWAAAGTYDVSIRYKATGGVTVKKRHLWVWTVGF